MAETTTETTTTFPQRVMALLEDEEVQKYMQWLPSGLAFEINSPKPFERDVLKEHFNSIKLESFVIRLAKWGFKRIDKKCNSRYMSYTFAAEFFRRDQPELCALMKLNNKKGKKLKPSKALEKKVNGNDTVEPPPPAMPMLVEIHPVMFFQVGPPQLGPQTHRMMPPSYPPPPQQFQQWHLPRSRVRPPSVRQPPPIVHQPPLHRAQPSQPPRPRVQPSQPPPPRVQSSQPPPPCVQPSQPPPPRVQPSQPPPPRVQPSIIYHGSQVASRVPTTVQHAQTPSPIHQPQPYKPQGEENSVKSDYKRPRNEPKMPLKDRLSGVETELKTEYKQKAEAAVAMMDLAGCTFSYKGHRRFLLSEL